MRTRCYPSDPTEAEWALAARHTRQRSPVVARVSSAISVAGVWVLPHRALYPRRNWQPVGGQPHTCHHGRASGKNPELAAFADARRT
jgi:hypothetical protein